MSNVVLIGMPGSGKSTLGVLLAKALGYSFIDTDLIISRKAGKPLQKILDEDGLQSFLNLEQEIGVELMCDHTIIATGGSMVLSTPAMEHLKTLGRVVYISVPFEEIRRRVTNITTRGIVFDKGETLGQIFEHREPLYKKYADITVEVDSAGKSIEQTVELAAKMINKSDD